jgi:hypothetical protein
MVDGFVRLGIWFWGKGVIIASDTMALPGGGWPRGLVLIACLDIVCSCCRVSSDNLAIVSVFRFVKTFNDDNFLCSCDLNRR